MLKEYAVVELFVHRARLVVPAFALTRTNAPAIAAICARLDGLPLAIELAAARTQLFPPHVLLDRLRSSLQELTDGPRDHPDRLRTLRDAIDWSYQLLTPTEQAFFAHLGVFSGGWSLEAAETVCVTAGDADTIFPAHGMLTTLVDKSLVTRTTSDAGQLRFGMLETLREYAESKLKERGEEEAVRRRHLAWCMSIATLPETTWVQRWDVARLALLKRELGNLQAALTWNLTTAGDAEAGLRLAESLCELWEALGYLSEGVYWLTALLKRNPDAPPQLRADTLLGAGRLASVGGDQETGSKCLKECEKLYEVTGDRRGLARAFNLEGSMALLRGDFVEAIQQESKSLQIFREIDELQGIAIAQQDLGNAIALDAILNLQFDPHKQRKMLDDAFRLIDESVDLHGQLGNQQDRAFALFHKGVAGFYLGQIELTLVDAGRIDLVAVAKQHVTEALTAVRDSLLLEVRIGNSTGLAMSLDGMAVVAGALGQWGKATKLFAFVDMLRKRISVPRQSSYEVLYQAQVASLRSALGDVQYEAAWVEGQALTQEEAIRNALE